MKRNYILLILLFHAGFDAFAGKENYLVRCNQKLVEVVMEDLFTPVVASRVNAYPNIAAYAVLVQKGKSLEPLEGKLNQYTGISAPKTKVDLSLSALFAFTTMAKKLVYSEYMFDEFEAKE